MRTGRNIMKPISAKPQSAEPNMQSQTFAKQACTLCARRKVKCDRLQPACTNCVKHRVGCHYEDPLPSGRHRKRKADSELLAEIDRLERLLRQHGISSSTDKAEIGAALPENLHKIEDTSFESYDDAPTLRSLRGTKGLDKHYR